MFLSAAVALGASNGVYAEELTVVVNNGANVVITPSVEGVYASTEDEGSTAASFSVSTDNYTGYNLSFTTGNTDEYATKLINVVNKNGNITTYALDSINTVVDGATFSSNDIYNNMWGIKPNKYDSLENANYLPVLPRMLIDNVKTSGTNNYTVDVAIRANYEYPAGKYTNTLVLAVVANPTAYEVPVNFAENTGVSSVSFKKVGEAGPAATVSATDEKAMLYYGANYEMVVTFEEGYELGAINATSGEYNEVTNTYKIEITDENPVLTVSGKVIE